MPSAEQRDVRAFHPPGRSLEFARHRVAVVVLAGALTACGGVNTDRAEAAGEQREAMKVPLPIGEFTSVAAGHAHACGLSPAGVIYCWGDKSNLATGEPTTALSSVPAPVPMATDLRFQSVVAGAGHACGLTANQEAFCWGQNDNGQLGHTIVSSGGLLPAAVPGHTFSQLAAGDDFTCGLEQGTNRAFCWGGNAFGQLGNGDATNLNNPVAQLVLGPNLTAATAPTFTQIAAGTTYACGLDSQQHAWCWGDPRGILVTRTGTVADRANVPLAYRNSTWSSISVGGSGACAIAAGGLKAGQAFCWEIQWPGSQNAGSPLWDGSVDGGLTYQSLAVGEDHSCGLTTGSDIVCWGSNGLGQLGNGATPMPALVERSPVTVAGSTKWKSVFVNAGSTCATDTADAVFCWGNSAGDRFGDNRMTTSNSSVPVRVASPRPIASLALGGTLACGAARDGASGGATFCWGLQHDLDLGVMPLESCPPVGGGTGVPRCRTTPWPAASGHTFTSLTTGRQHTCGLDPTGQAWCFGDNSSGQVGGPTVYGGFVGSASCPNGLGTCTSDPQPVVFIGGSFSQIAAGDYHTCGIDRTTKLAFCWGSNAQGQLGAGGPVNAIVASNGPVAVAGAHQFASIASGGAHNCAIDVNGDLYCWGSNNAGQAGIGTSGTVETTPVKVALAGTAVSVSAGFRHTCAMVRQGTSPSLTYAFYCWGGNGWGELGDGTTTMRTVPTLVSGGAYYLDFVAGYGSSCGIQVTPPPWPLGLPWGGGAPTSGPLYCWGILPGAPTGSNIVMTPTLVAPGVSFRKVRGGSGYDFLCGITNDGKTRCFGWNNAGQLGSADFPPITTTPEVVAGD